MTAVRADCHAADEANQTRVACGLFGNGPLWAVHLLGLGVFCPKWSVEPAVRRPDRLAAGIAENYALIMGVAVGQEPAQLPVSGGMPHPLSKLLKRI